MKLFWLQTESGDNYIVVAESSGEGAIKLREKLGWESVPLSGVLLQAEQYIPDRSMFMFVDINQY